MKAVIFRTTRVNVLVQIYGFYHLLQKFTKEKNSSNEIQKVLTKIKRPSKAQRTLMGGFVI